MRPPSRYRDEWVSWLRACPRGWKAREIAIVVVAVDPLFSPVVPVCDQLKPTPIQRMERVADVETSQLIITIGCT